MSSISEKKLTTFENQKDNFSFQENLFVHPFSRGFEFTISFFLFGAFFFHFAIFYTLFKIPEIRSVFKFTLFIFSKLWNSFFVVFFSIYNIFKRYTKNGFNLLKNSSSGQSALQSVSKNKKIENEKYLNPFLNKGNGKLYFQTDAFQSFVFSKNPKFFKSSCSHSKFDDFVFEFFPRFSAFSLNQETLFENFEPFSNFQKSQAYFSLKSNPFSFQSQFDSQKNFRQLFSDTQIFKNFFSRVKNTSEWEKRSFFLFKTSPYQLLFPTFQEQDGFSQNLQVQNFQRRFFSFDKKMEKSSHFQEQKLSKTEKNLSQFALSFLVFGKHILLVPYRLFQFGSSFFTKIFEIVESIFYAFYKFLEKPAEFMIEFIAFVFLIEWSSDILGFFPDSIESLMWKSSQKLLRPVRTGSFFLSFGIFFLGTSSKTFFKSSSLFFQTGQNFSVLNPFQFLLSTGFFQFSNFAGYVLQKRLFYVFENVPALLLQPDIDILVRQRKGILFWDIWSEILLKAAEKYNVNLPSFVTLKEEQELFLEKLVRDAQFFESFNPQHHQRLSQNTFFSSLQIGRANSKSLSSGIEKKNFEKMQNSAKSFSSFLQNFVIQNRPVSFFDFYFLPQSNSSFFFQKSKNTQKFQQFLISNLFSSTFDSKTDFQNSSSFSMPFGKQQNELSHKMLFNQGEMLQQNQISNSFFPLFQSQNQNFDSFQTFRDIGKNISLQESFSSFQVPKKGDRWECNQYTTFQSQETDFFLDIYPPKSLKHVHFLKYFEPSHYTLGSFICQIYAGLFPKQVSKNILVVGESGTAKTFFLRALAGETEMKIITENASRYAIVQRGVAVGMKYLRDVFDAIALQTPCFFVMEDLHILGAKRPFMISENENTQNNQSSFGLEQQEVHETNQMIYQSSRHSLSDFRRPYKGDFSMGIPTNYFLQTFYSPFFSSHGNQNTNKNSSDQTVGDGQDFSFSSAERTDFFSKGKKGQSIQKNIQFQNSQFFGGNFSSSVWNSLSSPLPIDSLEAILQNSGIQEKEKSHFESFSTKKKKKKIHSLLQFSKEQIFAPPATSPFTVLMMKEQKKLKPKKIVQETSWGGFSADQILSQGADQKESFSIRAKIAVLAEKTMNLSRGKFDMITDFLVIIDSVRSNRGFVVFGTTHKPSSLDPALRRPGRFDETLSLSRTPNFQNRFEIFKMNFENSVSTFDFFDASIFTENFSEMDLFDVLSQTKLSFFHNYKYSFQKSLMHSHHFPRKVDGREEAHFFGNPKNSVSPILGFKTSDIQKTSEKESEKSFLCLTDKKQMYSQISPTKAFHALLKSPLFEDFYTQKQFTLLSSKYTSFSKTLISPLRNSNFFFDQRYTLLPKGPSHMLSSAYSKLGVFLAQANLLYDPFSFVPLKLDIEKNSSKSSNFQKYYGNLFFDPAPHLSTFQSNGTQHQKNSQLLLFLSGKVAEFMICSSNPKNFSFRSSGTQFSLSPTNVSEKMNSFSTFEKPFSFFSEKFGIFQNSFEQPSAFQKNSPNSILGQNQNFFPRIRSAKKYTAEQIQERKKMNMSQVQDSFSLSPLQGKKNFYWTVYGNEESWRSATPFLHTLIQKRFFFTKNLLLSKMLFFENMDQRRKPPNPPGSSILMPSKKYENLKRTETDFFQKSHFSIHEKIHMHQKQRFLKQLYNIPVQTHFHSELRKNHKTLFSSSFQEFAYLDSFVQKSSSSHSYYRKYIQVRHRFSNVNQWWNGMFPEHTRETTYLSDVDWRTMFVSSKVDSKSQKMYQQIELENSAHKKMENVQKSSTETFEFLMDFPDAEQYYNPRNRRWFFKSNFQFTNQISTNSSFWSIFEKDLQYEIFSHYLMESFYQSFSYFEKKREMLDFFAFHLLSKGFLKEFDFLTTFSRF
jgi:SpoVK/Ycf46/Vps4 family AAA+-type ATPase